MRLFVQSEAESGKFPEVSRVLHLAVINPTLHTKRLTKDTVTVTVIGGIGQLKKWGKPRRTPLEAVCVTLFGAAGYVPKKMRELGRRRRKAKYRNTALVTPPSKVAMSRAMRLYVVSSLKRESVTCPMML
jgi:hypothetical protein